MYNSISIKCPEMKSIETDVCVVAWTKGTKNGLYTAVGGSSRDSKSKIPNLNCGAGCRLCKKSLDCTLKWVNFKASKLN